MLSQDSFDKTFFLYIYFEDHSAIYTLKGTEGESLTP